MNRYTTTFILIIVLITIVLITVAVLLLLKKDTPVSERAILIEPDKAPLEKAEPVPYDTGRFYEDTVKGKG